MLMIRDIIKFCQKAMDVNSGWRTPNSRGSLRRRFNSSERERGADLLTVRPDHEETDSSGPGTDQMCRKEKGREGEGWGTTHRNLENAQFRRKVIFSPHRSHGREVT